MVEILGMSKANTSDVLVITASNGENLKLAQRFVETAGSLGQSANLLDLTTIDLPLFTPRAQEHRALRRRLPRSRPNSKPLPAG